MRSEITIFCSNEGELREFVQRLLSRPAQSAVAFPEPVSPQAVIDVPVTLDTPKPARKPRADAGKPRGPYKNNAGGNQAEAQAGASEAAASAPVPVRADTSVPPAPTSAAPTSTPAEATAATEPSTAAEPTEADARAALGRINATAGLGMGACIEHLKGFGTNRITLLPKEKYAAFIKAADEKIASLNAGKK